MAGIGALNETPLHAALKAAVAPPGARFEVAVDGYVVDVVHDGLLIEVQTRHVGQLRRKLTALLSEHRVRLVLPVSRETVLVKRGATEARRRSPKRGHPADVARELVAIHDLIDHPGLEIELVLIRSEEVREHRTTGAWRRRGWVTVDRTLLEVLERRRWRGAAGLLELLPGDLDEPFGSAEVARAGGMRRATAQQLLYCLRRCGRVAVVGRAGNALRYVRSPERGPAAGA